jgi:hypothetical protein
VVLSPPVGPAPPTTYETPTARIALSDDGIVVVRVRKGAHQRPADARENLDSAVAATNGRRRPLLVDITGSKSLDAEARHLYSGERLVSAFTALALFVELSPLGKMMGNVYFRVARPGIPARLFTDEPGAVQWLKGFVE